MHKHKRKSEQGYTVNQDALLFESRFTIPRLKGRMEVLVLLFTSVFIVNALWGLIKNSRGQCCILRRLASYLKVFYENRFIPFGAILLLLS